MPLSHGDRLLNSNAGSSTYQTLNPDYPTASRPSHELIKKALAGATVLLCLAVVGHMHAGPEKVSFAHTLAPAVRPLSKVQNQPNGQRQVQTRSPVHQRVLNLARPTARTHTHKSPKAPSSLPTPSHDANPSYDVHVSVPEEVPATEIRDQNQETTALPIIWVFGALFLVVWNFTMRANQCRRSPSHTPLQKVSVAMMTVDGTDSGAEAHNAEVSIEASQDFEASQDLPVMAQTSFDMTATLKPGTVVTDGKTKYVIKGPLGSGAGAQATTFTATVQGKFGLPGMLAMPGIQEETVAIKVVSLRSMQGKWKKLELFNREVNVLKQLDHPSIPKYLNSFEQEFNGDQYYFLVQELVPGVNLSTRREEGMLLSEPFIEGIGLQLFETVEFLHSKRPAVVHRDIKPANIIIHDDKIYLVDFGGVQISHLSKPVKGETVVGTFGYMAPEQFTGGAEPASDSYAIGATLLFLATGQSPSDFPMSGLVTDISSVTLGDHLKVVIQGLMEPNPEKRMSIEMAQQVLKREIEPDAVRTKGSITFKKEVQLTELDETTGVTVCREGDRLTISIPQAKRGVDIVTVGVAAGWNAFTVAFVAAAVAEGAVVMSLFAIPFALAGWAMGKDALAPLKLNEPFGEISFELSPEYISLISNGSVIEKQSLEDVRYQEELKLTIRRPEQYPETVSVGEGLDLESKLTMDRALKEFFAEFGTEGPFPDDDVASRSISDW